MLLLLLMLWQQMLFDAAALFWKSSGCCKDFKFTCREEQEVPWQTDIKQIFLPNLTEEFKYVAFIL
jgi:hypothetical protein